MSLPTVNVSLTNPDPATPNPSSLQGLVDILNTLLVGALGGTYTPYVISSSTPAVSDQDKIWARLDSGGRPTGLYKFYNGNWRRFYNGKVGEITVFNGDPGAYFDGTGLGLVGEEWDGWAICNGQNSTPNLSNLFIVGGGMDNVGMTGYADGKWFTNITGFGISDTAGNAQYTLTNNNLPNMTVQLSGRVGYDDNASGSGQDPAAIVTKKWYGNPTPTPIPVLATFGANPSGSPAVPQVPIPIIPPFYTVAYAAWVGYA